MISTKDNPVVDKEEETSMITASVVMDVGNVPADESRARSSKKHKESERSRSWESDGSWRSDDSGDWSSTMEVHMQSMSKGCCERIKWFVNLHNTFAFSLSNHYAPVLLFSHEGGRY